MFFRILITLVFCLCFEANAAAPKVVVSIKPIHALVAGVMKGVGEPKLLLPANESAHHFSLTPSKADSINKADLFVWVGPHMEAVLEDAVEVLSAKGRVLTLMDLKDIKKHELEPELVDPHIWLDPYNAKVIVQSVADTLSSKDPDHSGIYQENKTRILAELDQMNTKLQKELDPLKGKQYFVYHDAFQYYEKAFGLDRSIPVVKDAEHTLRASQRKYIEDEAREKKIHCIFGEPNHGEKVVQSLSEQLDLQVGFLDPMGNDKTTHEGSYFQMMDGIASSLRACLLKGSK